MEKIINNILAAASLPPENKRLTFKKAWFIAILMEKIYGLFGIKKEPPLTRFVVAQLNTAHWYDPSAARNDLGYVPKISMKAGFELLKRSLAAP
jgi:nucleoside-diphosphate-sugar epimerase